MELLCVFATALVIAVPAAYVLETLCRVFTALILPFFKPLEQHLITIGECITEKLSEVFDVIRKQF